MQTALTGHSLLARAGRSSEHAQTRNELIAATETMQGITEEICEAHRDLKADAEAKAESMQQTMLDLHSEFRNLAHHLQQQAEDWVLQTKGSGKNAFLEGFS